MGTKGFMFDLNELPDDAWDSKPSHETIQVNNLGSLQSTSATSTNPVSSTPVVTTPLSSTKPADMDTTPLLPGQHPLSCFRPFVRSTVRNRSTEDARPIVGSECECKSAHPTPPRAIAVHVLPVQESCVPFNQLNANKDERTEGIRETVENSASADFDMDHEKRIAGIDDFEIRQAEMRQEDVSHKALEQEKGTGENGSPGDTKELQGSALDSISSQSQIHVQDVKGDASRGHPSTTDNSKALPSLGKRGRSDQKDAMLGKKRTRQTMFLDVREAARQAPPPKTPVVKKTLAPQYPFRSQKDALKTPVTQCVAETRSKDMKIPTSSGDGRTTSIELKNTQVEGPQPGTLDAGRPTQESARKGGILLPDGVPNNQSAAPYKQTLSKHGQGEDKAKLAYPTKYVVKQGPGKSWPDSVTRPVAKKNPNSLRKQFASSLTYCSNDSSIERLHREATCDKLWRAPGSFESVQEYVNVFEPLLFEECRAQLHSTWEELSEGVSKDPHTEVFVKTIEKRERGWFDLVILPHDKNARLTFKEGDVAVISTPKPGSAGRMRRSNSSGFSEVTDSELLSRTAGIIRRYIPVDTRDPHGACLRFYVGESGGSQTSEEPLKRKFQSRSLPWYLTVLGSLATTQREYVALHAFQHLNSQMIMAILHPRPELFPCYEEDPPFMPDCFTQPFVQHLHGKFNDPQLAAIKWAAMHTAAGFSYSSGAPKRLDTWPFTLVQGPPGTGKTHTVWGMLNVIHLVLFQKYYAALLKKLAPDSLKEDESPSDAVSRPGQGSGSIDDVLQKMDQSLARMLPKLCPKPRMLVCAPSNAATDELLTRVLERGFIDGEMKVYFPDVARVGVDTQSKASQAVSVERRSDLLLGMSRDDVLGWMQQLRAREAYHAQHIGSLQRELSVTSAAARSQGAVDVDPDVLVARDQTRDLKLQQLAAIVEERDKVLVEMSRMYIIEGRFQNLYSLEDARTKLEASFANEAEIVFTTLSSSGRRLFNHLTHGFDTVVIDEAAQASEVAVLPPLSLGAARCVLVGDPQQLPATVISRAAHTLQYSRSLFERFQQAGCPSMLLSVQYRMHPKIRDFPSRYFYQGRLTDSESVSSLPDETYHHDPLLRPYVFYDISHGRESHKGSSVSYQNVIEAQFAANLYAYLQNFIKASGLNKVSVGIITPYKLQLRCLQHEFGLVLGNNEDRKSVYINTVDAFQGQERDVIIMSCVRASSHGVGFVADIRRMNVALTRARRCLWVVGNAAALVQSEDWASLIADAKVRGCFVSMNTPAVKNLLTLSRVKCQGSSGRAHGLLRAPQKSIGSNKSGTVGEEDNPIHGMENLQIVAGGSKSGFDKAVPLLVPQPIDSAKETCGRDSEASGEQSFSAMNEASTCLKPSHTEEI